MGFLHDFRLPGRKLKSKPMDFKIEGKTGNGSNPYHKHKYRNGPERTRKQDSLDL